MKIYSHRRNGSKHRSTQVSQTGAIYNSKTYTTRIINVNGLWKAQENLKADPTASTKGGTPTFDPWRDIGRLTTKLAAARLAGIDAKELN